ncbi:MAG: hypothetical protein V4736_11210 [Bdellovibrionota bacterium]
MSRVLLLYDDYTELTTIELNLKKVGFDVIGISNEFSLSQQLLSFNPEVVIACGGSSRVNSVSVGKKLKDTPRWTGKSLLIFHPGAKPVPEDLLKLRMDFALEHPVPFTQLLGVLAQMLEVSGEALKDRWNKAQMTEEDDSSVTFTSDGEEAGESVFVTGGNDDSLASEINDLERREIQKEIGAKNWNKELTEYEQRRKDKRPSITAIAKEVGFDPRKRLSKKESKKRLKSLKEEWSEKELDSQDKSRQEFTRALFKKSR